MSEVRLPGEPERQQRSRRKARPTGAKAPAANGETMKTAQPEGSESTPNLSEALLGAQPGAPYYIGSPTWLDVA